MRPLSFFLFFIPLLLFEKGYSRNTPEDYLQQSGEFKPWFTGPIIAGSGRVLPKGLAEFQPYFNTFFYSKHYENNWKSTSIPTLVSFNPYFYIGFGLGGNTELVLRGGVEFNSRSHQYDARIENLAVSLGFQLSDDIRGTYFPDLKISISQEFPTGHYQHLNPKKLGTDITGDGLYKTAIALLTQKLYHFGKHLFRPRFNLIYRVSPKASVEGYNVYGGGQQTKGKVNTVHLLNLVGSFEYMITQNIVFAFDALWEYRSKAGFSGQNPPDYQLKGQRTVVREKQRISLAPALEYNFSDNIGIIGGCWFTVAGRNCPSFINYVFSVDIIL
jgi:hypothetical protein